MFSPNPRTLVVCLKMSVQTYYFVRRAMAVFAGVACGACCLSCVPHFFQIQLSLPHVRGASCSLQPRPPQPFSHLSPASGSLRVRARACQSEALCAHFCARWHVCFACVSVTCLLEHARRASWGLMSPGASLCFTRAGTVCVDHFYARRVVAGCVAEQLADCDASRAGHGVSLGRLAGCLG